MPPSAINGTPLFLQRFRDFGNRRDLRHADAGDDAGRADRARADADLDAIGARLDEGLGRVARNDVAANEPA